MGDGDHLTEGLNEQTAAPLHAAMSLDGDREALCRWITTREAGVAVTASLTDLASGASRARSARRRANLALEADLDAAQRATALYVRGTADLLLGDSERARRDLEEALSGALETSLRPLAQTNLAVVESRRGQHARARDLLQQVVGSPGASAAARLDLGILLEEHLGQPREALTHYQAYLDGPAPRRAAEVRQWVERLRRLYP